MGYVKKDFCTWLAIAFGVEGAVRAEPTPIAYSYNGVVLPGLPEWDKTAYPYVLITRYKTIFPASDTCKMYATSVPHNYVTGKGIFAEAGEAFLFSSFQTAAEVIPDFSQNEASGQITIGNNNTFWANYDILNEDGTIFLAGNDPLPIYE